MPVTPLADRLWSKVEKHDDGCPCCDGCWHWRGSLSHDGYPRIYLAPGKIGYAHRIAYELLIASIPEGHELDHICRRRSCVNPDHLEVVSHRENLLRGDTFAARQVAVDECPQGHAYTAKNTYEHAGRRHCRTCRSLRSRGLDPADPSAPAMPWRERRRAA